VRFVGETVEYTYTWMKLYERDLNSLVTTVSLFSNDIGMKIIVLNWLHIVKKWFLPMILKLGVIAGVSVSSGYKYLGLLQDILSVNLTVKRHYY